MIEILFKTSHDDTNDELIREQSPGDYSLMRSSLRNIDPDQHLFFFQNKNSKIQIFIPIFWRQHKKQNQLSTKKLDHLLSSCCDSDRLSIWEGRIIFVSSTIAGKTLGRLRTSVRRHFRTGYGKFSLGFNELSPVVVYL